MTTTISFPADSAPSIQALAQRIAKLAQGRPLEIGVSSSVLLLQDEYAGLLDGTPTGERAYQAAMRDIAQGAAPPLPMGTGLQFLVTLMRELNRPGQPPLVHPILISRNHDEAMRAIEASLRAHGLSDRDIGTLLDTPHFLRGASAQDLARLAGPEVLDLDLVITASRKDAQAMADAGLPVVLAQAQQARPLAEWGRVSREVTDLDGVAFNLDSEAAFAALLKLNQQAGLPEATALQRSVMQYRDFIQARWERGATDAPGPLARFLGLLGAARDIIRQQEPNKGQGGTDVLTARSGPAFRLAMFGTFAAWNDAAQAAGVPETPFAFDRVQSVGTYDGRLEKGPFLRPGVTVLFEDSARHVSSGVAHGALVAEAVRPRQYQERIAFWMQQLVKDGFYTLPTPPTPPAARRREDAGPTGTQ